MHGLIFYTNPFPNSMLLLSNSTIIASTQINKKIESLQATRGYYLMPPPVFEPHATVNEDNSDDESIIRFVDPKYIQRNVGIFAITRHN